MWLARVWWNRQRPSSADQPWQVVQARPHDRAAGFAEAIGRAADRVARFEAGQPLAPAPDGAEPAQPAFPSEGPHGHRVRMRDKLLDRGAGSLADYELLEMLLFFAQPKGDTKPIAKRLINQFGSYANALAAEIPELEKVPGIGRTSVAAIKLVHGSALRLARAEMLDKPVLGNPAGLFDYLTVAMARERVEHFRILFLDTKNRLIADEVQGRGTINHSPVYPREVARRALELHAAAVILAHNHPSGDPTPSEPDLDMTMRLQRLLRELDIALHDHIIVGNGRWTSLRNEGFL